jgi:phosphatidyl-myo-inositol dimannoside synthase
VTLGNLLILVGFSILSGSKATTIHMKICYLTHDMHPHTGIGKVSINLVDQVVLRHPEWHVSVVVEESSGHPLEIEIVKTDKQNLIKTILHLRSLFKKYDLIHALDGYPYGFVAVMSTIGLGKKIFITGIGSGAVNTLNKPLFGSLIRLCYKRADKFFAISRYTARKVQEYIHGFKIVVVNLGVHIKKRTSNVPDTATIKQITDAQPYILTVGSFKARKGQKELILAYIEAVKKVPELNYVFVGNVHNAYVDDIKSLINKAGLTHKVYFLGNVSEEELEMVYENAFLFAMLHKDIKGNPDIEGFGLVYLEAAALGVPIIGSTEGPSEDAINVDKNGVLVDPHDIGAISNAIVRISTDDALREKMSSESRDFAGYMSWEKHANEYMPYYELYAKDS